jgi:Heavy metal binding domain
MKKLLILCFVAMFSTMNAQADPAATATPKMEKKAKKAKKSKKAKKVNQVDAAFYECPMKCTAPSKTPGKCTKCGMELEKKS